MTYESDMSSTMTVSEARAALPQILRRVLTGEEVTITRHGEPVAVIVRPDTLRARRASERLVDVDRLRDVMASARRATLPAHPTLGPQRAEELVADVRAARASR